MKKTTIYSLCGFLFLSALLVVGGFAMADIGEGLSAVQGTDLPQTGFWDVLVNVVRWMLGILAVLAVIAFVGSGIMYITSGGGDRKEKAKDWMVYAIVGLIVALLAYVIVYTIDYVITF